LTKAFDITPPARNAAIWRHQPRLARISSVLPSSGGAAIGTGRRRQVDRRGANGIGLVETR
jgi:hypothetical protein